MPQDVAFDLPFDTPVSRHLELIVAPLRPAGSRPRVLCPVEAAHLGSGGLATPDGPRVLPDQHG